MKRLFTKFIVFSLVFMTIGGFSQAQVNNIDFETGGVESCSGTSTEASQGSFDLGYNYTFETVGTTVTVTFEMLDQKEGVVAFLWNKDPFSEKEMTHVDGKKFTTTLSGKTVGSTIEVACKFAFAGGMAVTEYISYQVGDNCGGEADTEAPTSFVASKGDVTSNSIELVLSATDNSGSVTYYINYGTTKVSTTGTSGTEKRYKISGLSSSTNYSFSVVAKDASGNTASNSPIVISAKTLESSTPGLGTIDFETIGHNWSWTLFDNADNAPELYEVVSNPNPSGINTSPHVAKYSVNTNGAPWAGLWSNNIGEFTFDENNSTVKVMVYKDVISPFGVKFEKGDVVIEINISNTVVNEWEELTFDFTPHIGKTVNKLVLLPDFPNSRTAGSTNYFDNIVFESGTPVVLGVPTVAAPTPTAVQEDVISIFSNTYNNIAGANYNPYWEQATEFSMFDVAGKDVLKYAFLNYQGIEFVDQDVTEMNFINIDVWSPDATSVNFSLISRNSGEKSVLLSPIAIEAWTTFSIPLTEYSSQDLNLDEIYQFKLDQGQSKTFYIDNLYFSKEAPTSVNAPSENANISVYPNPVVDRITVSSVGEIKSVKIESLTGKQVLFSTERNVDLGSIPSGIYLISVELENGQVSTRKIIKQ